ncbi:Ubiquinone/menaquinone biosynthesis C-methylase UbiE [Peptoclostridium litorale DSM 5388]|uniref:Methyltransferase n=1 Tax=Peptoclostridium litorale DSM 5388 TaxID=1121324 RepID=A0A069RGK8_PEPLI|nr:class I SAM-dependent methyltransferase [Peptoclostridium litorale]KDR93888.1 methyltransferase [Peptoclostridium litorale DSM 5388]KDR95315.1 methyltransferase [Peptoclostridium litorale DSM 5388]SIN87931.1 Ubiquinone/menaquinone biosynthesis C-methylase UbiE [Peptoclostridium litorale DSM 5388]
MDCYGEFANIYDELMGDVDYEMWSDYIEALINEFSGIDVENILELACGTGNITIPMAQKGYSVTGMDISEDMLCIAKGKLEGKRLEISLVQSDMKDFEYDAVRAQCVICACDGFNYITDENSLGSIFEKVYNMLPKGGTFIFDISSSHKLKNIISQSTFTHVDEDTAYIWENYYDEDLKTVDMELTFFVRENSGLYRRFDELHVQRVYENEEILKMLQSAGFKCSKALSEFSFEEDNGMSERVFFAAVK